MWFPTVSLGILGRNKNMVGEPKQSCHCNWHRIMYMWSSQNWVFRVGRLSRMWRRVIRIKFCLTLESISLDSVCVRACVCVCMCNHSHLYAYTSYLFIGYKNESFCAFYFFSFDRNFLFFPHSLSFTSNFIRALVRSLSTVRGHSVILTFCLRSWLLSDLSARPSDLLLQWRQEQ